MNKTTTKRRKLKSLISPRQKSSRNTTADNNYKLLHTTHFPKKWANQEPNKVKQSAPASPSRLFQFWILLLLKRTRQGRAQRRWLRRNSLLISKCRCQTTRHKEVALLKESPQGSTLLLDTLLQNNLREDLVHRIGTGETSTSTTQRLTEPLQENSTLTKLSTKLIQDLKDRLEKLSQDRWIYSTLGVTLAWRMRCSTKLKRRPTAECHTQLRPTEAPSPKSKI